MSINIVVFGSSYITAALIKSLLYLPDVHIIVIDRKDPHYVLNQNLLAGIESLSNTISDLKKNIDYTKSFKLVPEDPLSFLYFNPITDSMKIQAELLKLDKIDIVLDSAMMFDPHYSESNSIDSVNINTTYPTAIFDVLSGLTTTPKLYIALSSGIVYGKQDIKNLPSKEITIPHPIGVRAGSLLARENLVTSLSSGLEIPYIILRLGNPIGYYTPYENVLNQIIKNKLLKQAIVIEGDGTQARDFFDLNDLVKLIYQISANVTDSKLPEKPQHQVDESDKNKKRLTGFEYIEKIKNQIYNIGGSKTKGEGPINLITLDRLVITALGEIKIPEGQGKIVVKNSRRKELPFRFSFEKNIVIQMDIAKAQDLLEYEPVYNLLDTIKAESIPYVADNFLQYTEEQMEDLKKQLRL